MDLLGGDMAQICRVLVPSDMGGGFITLKCDANMKALMLKKEVLDKVTAKR